MKKLFSGGRFLISPAPPLLLAELAAPPAAAAAALASLVQISFQGPMDRVHECIPANERIRLQESDHYSTVASEAIPATTATTTLV